MRREVETKVRGLLRVLQLRICAVPTNSDWVGMLLLKWQTMLKDAKQLDLVVQWSRWNKLAKRLRWDVRFASCSASR